jgi:Ca2+-binding RTX toxin-like protein
MGNSVPAGQTLVYLGSQGADTITGTDGADILTGGNDDDIFVFNSSSESAASVAAETTRTFDSITDFTSGSDKIQIATVGLVDFSSTATASVNTLSFVDLSTFADLVSQMNVLEGSTSSVAQVYDITLTGTGLAASGLMRLLIVNDGDTVLDAEDLMIQLQPEAYVASGDILFTDVGIA